MQASHFVDALRNHGITAYYGVPDSLLKSFCAYITDHTSEKNHIITANEGNAIGLACGHYLATGHPALVYMQNSGQGNCVNPLLSLMDDEVYSIPVLLLIGWRGEPGVKDEPQHIKQGKVTLSLLDTLGIQYQILSNDASQAREQVREASRCMASLRKPYALIAKKDTFAPYTLQSTPQQQAAMTREEAICMVADALDQSDIVVSTTGQISRELYEFRTRTHASHHADFLTVGGMGHASSIAMGIALEKQERRVICMDGDGAFLMHMGAAAIIGQSNLRNMRHIVINNSAHDSVGGQPTVAGKLNLNSIATACGYKSFYQAHTPCELKKLMPIFLSEPGPSMLEIEVNCGSRADLGRPQEKPIENKNKFMAFLEEGQAHLHPGALQHLPKLIAENHWQHVLLFCTEGRLNTFNDQLKGIFKNINLTTYTNITPNPTEQEITSAITQIKGNFDAIVALGGGSCIDFAKLYRAATDNNIAIREYFHNPVPLIRITPLVAIPTTAGTGSEATRFAVVYIDGEKYSLDAPAVMPDYALVDCELMSSAPSYLKASCGMDAFAQAIEGYWANGATPDSDSYAEEAIRLCKDHLVSFVNGDNPESAKKMAKASYLAGKCISIARTTAAHALSYKITQLHGIPHGHAVALSLPGLAKVHLQNAAPGSLLYKKMQWLTTNLDIQGTAIDKWFHDLYTKIGLEYTLHNLGIASVNDIVDGVNTQRLSNNPLPLTKDMMRSLY